MLAIQGDRPLVPAERACPDVPDWDAMLPELQHAVCRLLGLGDLKQLRLVSHHWKAAVEARLSDLQRCDTACAEWVREVEAGAWRAPPRFDRMFAGDARSLAPRFPHVALVLNLRAFRASLEAGAIFPVTQTSVPITDLADLAGSCGVRLASGDIVFVGQVEEDDGTLSIIVCDADGRRRAPQGLRGAVLAVGDQNGDPVIHGATVPPGREVLPVLRRDGSLALFCPATDRLEPLPDALTGDPEDYLPYVALSADARQVGVLRTTSLQIFDRQDGALIASVAAGGAGFTIDQQGDVFVGRRPGDLAYEEADPWDASFEEATEQGFMFDCETREWRALPDALGRNRGWLVLSPDGRYFLKHVDKDGVIMVDRKTPDAPGITLRPTPDGTSRSHASAVGISRAQAVIAVAYGDCSICLFDVAESQEGDILEPKATLRLPPSAQGQAPSLLFSEDGTRLDVVYRSESGAEFLSYALT